MSDHYPYELPVDTEREERIKGGVAVMVGLTILLAFFVIPKFTGPDVPTLAGYNGKAQTAPVYYEDEGPYGTDCMSFRDHMTPQQQLVAAGDYLRFFRTNDRGNDAIVSSAEAKRFREKMLGAAETWPSADLAVCASLAYWRLS